MLLVLPTLVLQWTTASGIFTCLNSQMLHTRDPITRVRDGMPLRKVLCMSFVEEQSQSGSDK